MSAHVSDRDHGYRKMMRGLDKSTRGIEVTVGVHEEEGSSATASGKSVAEVAEINEFGEGPPARPAITGWADDRESKVLADLRKAREEALAAGKSVAQRADQLAQGYAGEIQARIAGGIPPPNAESTIRKKGSSTPLVDKGIFRSSIRGKVREA
jgi:hypothetical protein